MTDKQVELFISNCKDILGLEPIQEYKFHPTRRWRLDFAFVDIKLAIEIEGGVWTKGRHITPSGFAKDMEKYNNLTMLGWRLLRFEPKQINLESTYKFILDTIKTIRNES